MGKHTRFQINTPAVVSEEIDGEVVIINLETGNYYSLRDSSVALWKLLQCGVGVEEATRILVEPTGADPGLLHEEVVFFIEELQAEALVVESGEQTPPPSLPPLDGHLQPGSLRLERHDEMQEMLLYDPIHDVDKTGWPNRPEMVVAPSEGDSAGRPQEP